MKKIICTILTVMMLLTVAGCSGKDKEPEPTLHQLPDNFTEGYQEAEFRKYNSNASENGLGGSKIIVLGAYDEVMTLDSEEMVYYYSVLTDDKGNKWILNLDLEMFTDKDTYEKLCGHKLAVAGIYAGFSGVYQMPVLYAAAIFDRETGSTVNSVLTRVSYDDLIDPDNYKQEEPDPTPVVPDKDPEPEPEPEPRNDNKTIRKDVKEAIDAYENFIDEYVKFMKKYKKSDYSVKLLSDYMEFLTKLTEYEEKMDALEQDLNDAELAYFTKVMLRCEQKLLKAM